MKIDPNEPAHPVTDVSKCQCLGIPIRLEIAARFMATVWTLGLNDNTPYMVSYIQHAKNALYAADALINKYNKQEDDK